MLTAREIIELFIMEFDGYNKPRSIVFGDEFNDEGQKRDAPINVSVWFTINENGEFISNVIWNNGN